MKKFILDEDFLEVFPEARLGYIVCNGVNNRSAEANKYRAYLDEAQEAGKRFVTEDTFTDNEVIALWREAFRKFKTKKGARCSIEAMLKRVSRGDSIGCINDLVDIYNGVSLRFGVPIGGEDIDKMEGDLHLTLAEGEEEFITYGSDKSEPPYPGEVIYKDNVGAVCRCWNWREGVRTALTEETTNAFMIIEAPDASGEKNLVAALEELKNLIETELGATCTSDVLSAEKREGVIA